MATPDTRINLRDLLWRARCENFLSEQPGRFEHHAGPDPFDPMFDGGMMHYCSTSADAYLLIREFETAGIPVTLIHDLGITGEILENIDNIPQGVQIDMNWVVLTAPYKGSIGTTP